MLESTGGGHVTGQTILAVHEFTVCDAETGRRLTADELHEQGNQLMEALLDLEDCNDGMCDSTVSTDATRGILRVEFSLSTTDKAEAFAQSLTIARSAIHAIGGHTPDWPTDRRHEPTTRYTEANSQLEYA